MNRSMDKRLAALEAQLFRPAIVTKLSVEGFDFDEYQRVMLDVVSHDDWFSKWQMGLGEWAREHEGKQKVSIFGKGWIYESH